MHVLVQRLLFYWCAVTGNTHFLAETYTPKARDCPQLPRAGAGSWQLYVPNCWVDYGRAVCKAPSNHTLTRSQLPLPWRPFSRARHRVPATVVASVVLYLEELPGSPGPGFAKSLQNHAGVPIRGTIWMSTDSPRVPLSPAGFGEGIAVSWRCVGNYVSAMF